MFIKEYYLLWANELSRVGEAGYRRVVAWIWKFGVLSVAIYHSNTYFLCLEAVTEICNICFL